jgi:exodeoxyribonuclease VII large subunit
MLTPVFQVCEFVELINNHLELLDEVVVEGELGRIDVKNNRLIFATIKDKQSTIDVFGLTYAIRNIRELQEGMLVQVYGRPGLYKGSGRFRLQASMIVPHGEGAMQIAFEKLRLRLEEEGLFDESHKRPLPEWPEKVTLVTAANSSAYFDLVKIIQARMGSIVIKHIPVNVQGAQAVPSIIKALAYINSHCADTELVIIARGGGSADDLKAFNDEELVRTVFSLKVPVISAVGHEDNWSLCDYVADARASTPSNAAEMATKEVKEELESLDSIIAILHTQLIQHAFLMEQKVDIGLSKINSFIKSIESNCQLLLLRWDKMQSTITNDLSNYSLSVTSLMKTMNFALERAMQFNKARMQAYERLISTLDIQHILNRGFSITLNAQGKLIRSADQVNIGDMLGLRLAKGSIQSTVTKTSLKEEYE